MIGRVISYIFTFLLTLYCFYIYDDYVIKIVLAVEVIYFVIIWIYMILVKKKISAEFSSKELILEKNIESNIGVRILSDWPIGIVNYGIILVFENLVTGEKKKYRTKGCIIGRKTKLLLIPLCVKECGNIKVSVDKLEIFDPLFILKVNKKVEGITMIGVLPKCRMIPLEVARKTRDFIADAEEYSDRESGDDPSEIYQIREYREGDSIRKIHWKLSAKEDELIVKENGRPLSASVLIWMNLEEIVTPVKKQGKILNKGKKNNITNALEIVASLSYTLLELSCVHMIIWYESVNNSFYIKRISKEEHILQLLYRMLYIESYKKDDAINIMLNDKLKGMQFSTKIEIKTDGSTYIDGERIEVPQKNNKVLWEEFYMKV